jgi:NarL family two-component system response regulator LiaR
MTGKTIGILIVDDYAVVRQGLRALIDTTPDIYVVGEAADGLSAVHQANTLRPDITIMDLMLPGLDGIEAIAAIKQANAQARILVLTNFGDEPRVLAALRAGAQGYLLKDAVLTDVLTAIREVHAGRLTLHPSINHILMRAMQKTPEPEGKTAGTPALTNREQDVLRLVAKGLTNQMIADQLQIDERTVRIHVSHILQKLGLENRTQATLYALRHGFATLD